jgi:hypothetical protein
VYQDSDGKILVLIMPKEFVLCRATANELQGENKG